MIPLSVFNEELPAISAKLGIGESTLSSALHTAGPVAASRPTGAHLPGYILFGGFKAMKEAYFAILETGVLEKVRAGQALVPVSVTYETADTTGAATVSAADRARLQAEGKEIVDDIFGD
ncbi:hypothetical protein [Nocardia sp. NPDC024068]|uniref:hypothetical protein n=1 Tax=Nocardia sp. NPDC024068 TaxID=3157197 RepID=UPI0033EE971C